MTTSEQLEATAQLLEKGWTQGSYAADAQGFYVSYLAKDAAKFCLTGALWRTVEEESEVDVLNFLDRVIGVGLAYWNDDPSRTQSEVVAAVREAARLAREQEA